MGHVPTWDMKIVHRCLLLSHFLLPLDYLALPRSLPKLQMPLRALTNKHLPKNNHAVDRMTLLPILFWQPLGIKNKTHNNAKRDDVHLSKRVPLAFIPGRRRAGTLASTSAAVCRRRGNEEQQVLNKVTIQHLDRQHSTREMSSW